MLKKSFNHKSFKSEQWNVIRAVIYDKQDCVFVARATFGKSLCFQFPAVFLNKIAVVISPLSVVAEDKIQDLKRQRIKTCYLSKVQEPSSVNLQKYQIIFVDKEDLECFDCLIALGNQICVIAIDVFHCISFDYRSRFQQLAKLKNSLPGVPTLCLSSTAIDRFRDHDILSLDLKNPLLIKTSQDRTNLIYTAIQFKQNFEETVCPLLRNTTGQVIIFVKNKLMAHCHSENLRLHQFDTTYCHDLISEKRQRENLKCFAEGRARIVVTTIDYAMELNRADVRTIVFMEAPESFEKFHFSTRCAGRDNNLAKIILVSERNICENKPMDEFLETTSCRRFFLLRYFDASCEEFPNHETCCDNCQHLIFHRAPLNKLFKNVKANGQVNISADARNLLKYIVAYKEVWHEESSLKFFMGEIPSKTDKKLPLAVFGKGKTKPLNWWSKMLNILIEKRLIYRKHDARFTPSSHLKITSKGLKFTRRQTLKLRVQFRSILKFLKRTNREYFIENGELKCKQRNLKRQERKTVETITFNNEIFKFESPPESSSPLKQSTTGVKEVKKLRFEESESDDNDDESIENLVWARKNLQKPLKIPLEDLLDHLENCERQER